MNRKNEGRLQAVVFTDTFDDEFYPITQDIPSTLIPLLNKPILCYTLEALQEGGVEEVFLFCKSGIPAIKEFIRKAKEEELIWTLLTITLITSESTQTLGDCLRELDARGKIRGDFVLVEPGAITNIDLLPIFKKHKEITKKDKGACMTMICMRAGVDQTVKCVVDDSLYVTNPEGKLIFFKTCGKSEDKRTNESLDLMLSHHDGLLWSRGLRDIRISICSPKFLPLFSDNFDFQTKEEFIKNLLTNEEILDCTMYVHQFSGNFHGGAVLNWQNYQALSFEVGDMYSRKSLGEKGEVNSEDSVHRTVIGQNTKIPKCAKLSRCVLGENVTIGKNVRLEESFIFSNCVISDNVEVRLSVVGPNCTLRNNCQIINNCVLGENVQIEENAVVDNRLVQATRPELCEDKGILGQHAYIIHLERNDVVPGMNTVKDVRERLEMALEYVESDSDDDQSSRQSAELDDTEFFLNEVIESLTRGVEDDVNCENLIFEINGSRYAYHIALEEVNFFVVKAILKMYSQKASGLRYLSTLLSKFSPILKNYIRKEESMKDCLAAIEDQAVSSGEEEKDWVLFVLKWFYQNDILSEEAILSWGKALHPEEKLFIKIQPFLKWLEEADEESSEEED